ncbi:MAG: CopD family protein [Thermoflexales bacterium]
MSSLALWAARSVVVVAVCALAGGLLVEKLSTPVQAADMWRAAASRRRRWLRLWAIALALGSLVERVLQPPSYLQAELGLVARLLALMAVGLSPDSPRWSRMGLALLLTASRSLQSRSAQLPDWLLPTVTDWLHLSFSALWLGGVGYLAAVATPPALRAPQYLPMLGRVVERFSTLAVAGVLVLGITGIAQSAGFVVEPRALVTTDYGRALLLKLALSLPVLALGAFHHLVIRPRLNVWHRRFESAAHEAARRFVTTASAEALLAVALLIAAAALTVLPAVSELNR